MIQSAWRRPRAADYVRNSQALFAGDSTLAKRMIRDFLIGKELNPDEEFASGATLQAGTSKAQEMIDIVSLHDGMDSLFEELNMQYSIFTRPVERDEMMGYVDMIESVLEDSGFSLFEENRTNVQNMREPFEELNGLLPRYHDVLAEKHCAKPGIEHKVHESSAFRHLPRMRMARLRLLPSRRRWSKSFTLERHLADPPIQTKRSALEQLCKQPRPPAGSGKNHRVKCPTMARLEERNTDEGIDKCSAHDEVLGDGTLAVQKMTREASGAAPRQKSSCQTPSQDTV